MTKHIFVQGRVQGVSFRYFTKQKADELGLHGWVRNQPDGRVEIIARGAPSQMNEFLKWLQRGPEAARVDQVTVHDTADDSDEPVSHEFQILRNS